MPGWCCGVFFCNYLPLENTLNDKLLRLLAFPSEFSTEAFFRGSGLLLNHPSKQIKDRVYAVWFIFK